MKYETSKPSKKLFPLRANEFCAVCGKLLKSDRTTYWVPGSFGLPYKTVLTPSATEVEDLRSSQFTGYYPVGRDCYRNLPENNSNRKTASLSTGSTLQ